MGQADRNPHLNSALRARLWRFASLDINKTLYGVVTLFIIIALVTIPFMSRQSDAAKTTTLTLLVVLAAILQLIVMLRQTSILARQDEILSHRAKLTCFAQTGPAQTPYVGSFNTSIRIAVINDGTRGAQAFHLYVKTAGAVARFNSGKWVSLDNNLYHRTIQTPLFANDAMWIKAFIVCYATDDKTRDLQYRIAYEDDASDWLPLGAFNNVPSGFKPLLELLQDTED